MEVAGVSYFKVKRKAIPDAGSLSDTCITAGQNYHVIYAYGQLTANASHTPNSALEIIPPAQQSNQDFYQVRLHHPLHPAVMHAVGHLCRCPDPVKALHPDLRYFCMMTSCVCVCPRSHPPPLTLPKSA